MQTMLVHVPRVLTADQVNQCRQALYGANWVDGRVTAGHQSGLVKDNMQVPEDHPTARKLGEVVLKALEQNALFLSAALPLKVFPPLFNRYAEGQTFGIHVDGAVRQVPGTPHRVRTDLSATLFLSTPEDYDGGELTIEDTYGAHGIKLPAGDMILYPASSLHHVRPVTRGVRLACFFWVQSMVREDSRRAILFDLDNSIQRLAAAARDDQTVVQLTNVYHNLLREWVDA
jgi:PKHD-type hydroxylase